MPKNTKTPTRDLTDNALDMIKLELITLYITSYLKVMNKASEVVTDIGEVQRRAKYELEHNWMFCLKGWRDSISKVRKQVRREAISSAQMHIHSRVLTRQGVDMFDFSKPSKKVEEVIEYHKLDTGNIIQVKRSNGKIVVDAEMIH